MTVVVAVEVTGVVAIVDREGESEGREEATEAEVEVVVAAAVDGGRSASGLDEELESAASDLQGVAGVFARELAREQTGRSLPPPPSHYLSSQSQSLSSRSHSPSLSSLASKQPVGRRQTPQAPESLG